MTMETPNYKIKINPQTGGYYAFFNHDGFEFYADLSLVPEGFSECMIFHSENKQVTSWRDLYCKINIPISEESLKECIKEFIDNYDKQQIG